VSFTAITLCVASQRVFNVVYFVIDSVRKILDTPHYFRYIMNDSKRFIQLKAQCKGPFGLKLSKLLLQAVTGSSNGYIWRTENLNST
jgi:hypothetical protein